MELCAQTRRFKATDPRDKILDLVGLAFDADAQLIDYGLHVPDLYIRLAKSQLLHTIDSARSSSLDFLSHVVIAKEAQQFSLPTWVPVFQDVHMPIEPLAVAFPTNPSSTCWTPEIGFGSDQVSLAVLIFLDSIPLKFAHIELLNYLRVSLPKVHSSTRSEQLSRTQTASLWQVCHLKKTCNHSTT